MTLQTCTSLATRCRAGCLAILIGTAPAASGYPLDGVEHTGIGRLIYQNKVEAGELTGTRVPSGATLSTPEVDLRLLEHREMDLPAVNEDFSREIAALLGDYVDRYAISVLDYTVPGEPRYAELQGEVVRNPGSVGKLAVATGIFQALADIYPDDIQARWDVIRNSRIIADDFVISDHHTVRRWDRENGELIRRSLQPGDPGTLAEFMDWMMSASSNSAASALMKEGMLLLHFGRDYPPSNEAGQEYFRTTPKPELGRVLAEFIQTPLTRNGIPLDEFRQGSFFTRVGKNKVPGTTSRASVRGMMKWVLRLEQGRIVDEFSSREIKRFLYNTERRIRYASSPVLNSAAVYFKSGSLFRCKPEPDFTCRPYQGNDINYMNSVAIVETPKGDVQVNYAVTLMSNVLKRNSAVDHQSLAGRIHKAIIDFHKQRTAPAAPETTDPGAGAQPDMEAE